MAIKREPLTVKGRSFGIAVLTGVQILIGVIHTVSGLLLLGSELVLGTQVSIVYGLYTIAFGLLTLIFAFMLW